ncbi:MAG: MFS transporter [Desulfovibrionaceae bacterium]|nr:MFS transporter [Desulfovibrionaceae bacterium]
MPHQHVRQDLAIKTYVCLLLLTACSYTLMYGPQPMFNIISHDLDVDRAHIGLLVSVFMLALSVAPLCVGLLLSRVGIRRAVFATCSILALSGLGIYVSDSFAVLLSVRIVQGILVPVVLTSAMACVASLFRHLDLSRALAGFITASLLGSLTGRIFGGVLAAHCGWRLTLTIFSFLFVASLYFARGIPSKFAGQSQHHHLSDYFRVLRQEGVGPLLLVEACGIFTFAAIGNLIPLRLAELGQGGHEGFIGLMYLGYSIGLVASLAINPLKRLFGSAKHLVLFGSLLYVVSLTTLIPDTTWTIFAGLWLIAFGEFIVHALTPGFINQLATHAGETDHGLVNGLFLSCYYLGGTLGSWLPGFMYVRFGWSSCLGCMFFAQTLAVILIVTKSRKLPVH